MLNQFNNDTKQLKLVVVALGSKYSKTNGFVEPLINITNSMLWRGIKVVLMTRPPIDTAPRAPLWFDNYNITSAMEINDMVRSVEQQTGAACLDTWQLFMATGDNWKVLSSGAPSPAVSGASQCLGLHTGRGFTPVFHVPAQI